MKCPNDPGPSAYSAWICLCNYGKDNAKAALTNLFNGWLQPDEIARARRFGADPDVSEEQASMMLKRLEQDANHAYSMWRSTQ